jgi:elongation factor G
MPGRLGGAGAADAAAYLPDSPAAIRNVVLVGPSGSGKTTLVESLLAATGVINRTGRVEDGTTVSDYDEAEIRQQRSVGLSLAPFVLDGVKINLLDTPGYADFVGELRAGLRAADCALFVISASDGVDGATRALWLECESVGMPRCVVISKLNHPRADYDSALAQARDVFGDSVVPLYVPEARTGADIDDLVALLSQTVSDYSDSAAGRTVRAPDEDEQLLVEEYRPALIEALIEESEDEGLMDRYMSGEEIDVRQLIDDLETAVARGSFFPVIPVCAHSGLGLEELLEVITSAFPPPPEHPFPAVYTTAGKKVTGLSCDPTGDLLAEVVKTTSDPYVGRISLVRVFSGTLRPDAVVHVSGHLSDFSVEHHGSHQDHDEDERIGALSSPLGKTQRPSNAAIAGDICAVAKLSRAETGDTLSDKSNPLVMEPWSMPEPLLPVALVAHAKADEDKLGPALQRLAAEDPTVAVEHHPETLQLVLWCLGEAHADVLLDRLGNRYGVRVDQVDVRVPLRETFSETRKGRGRHVKQSGGHGQFAVCEVEVEPLPPGSGFEFVDKVVGGSVPRQFIPSVEKGVRAQLEKGLTAGYPVVDLRVTLYDGKAHSVDSSDMAFQTAGALALREAAASGGVQLLEPIDMVEVLIDDDYVGAVMGDLSTRRAHVLGTEPVGSGRTMVRAEAPQLELVRYATDLRSLSHGTGTFSRSFSRYDTMPSHVASRMTAAS